MEGGGEPQGETATGTSASAITRDNVSLETSHTFRETTLLGEECLGN
jgi:hypothetical protein